MNYPDNFVTAAEEQYHAMARGLKEGAAIKQAKQQYGDPIDRGQSPQLMQALAVHEKMLSVLRDSLGMLGERLNPITPQRLVAEAECGTSAGVSTRPKSEVVVRLEQLSAMVADMDRRVRSQMEVMDL